MTLKKILLLPLLNSMPSGHHQVSDAIEEFVSKRTSNIECKKIDVMKEWNPLIELSIVNLYLSWIRLAPGSYASIYRQFAYKSKKSRSYKYYDVLFLNKVEKILAKEKPDLIICTHSFPSHFINELKKSGKCSVPCINIYTDFFMNDVWGKEYIDYHFVPDIRMKNELRSNYRISENNIFPTGIPISQEFSSSNSEVLPSRKGNILISGGSAGLGNILDMLEESMEVAGLNFYVLCGNNKALYQKVKGINKSNIYPLPYISSKEKMNELYNMTDAIITKPGGVTVTEALKKMIPIFVHSALPGQEEINLTFLCKQKLVFNVPEGEHLIHFVQETLNDRSKIMEFQHAVQAYNQSLTFQKPNKIVNFIQEII